MSNNFENKILIRYKDFYFDFLSIIFHRNDASIMICINKKDDKKRINYHSTGQVNFHGILNEPRFFDPLCGLDSNQQLLRISISDLELLDKIPEELLNLTEKESSILVNDDDNPGLSFSIGIRVPEAPPKEFEVLQYLIGNTFSVIINRESYSKNGISTMEFEISESKYKKLQSSIEEANIKCHQRMIGSRNIIIFPPNGESVVKIIPVVPMRIVPRVKIDFLNSGFSAKVITQQSKNYRVALDVRAKGGAKIKELPPFKSIELDAEL